MKDSADISLFDITNLSNGVNIPFDTVSNFLFNHNTENANITPNPEAVNLFLAENVLKNYALNKVFSKEVSNAHINGDIHIHDLGFPRPYCSGNSVEYIKKYGLNFPNALSIAKPAKHAEILIAHLIKFAAMLQGYFAGAIGFDAVNLFISPYLEGRTDKDVEQLAQILIYEFSQQSVARGGQAIFSDINLYWEVPRHFRDTPAIGKGGEYTGKTYAEYEKDAQRFIWALFDVFKKGDGIGRPFFFPKPNLHITEDLFKTEGHEAFLLHVCEVVSEKGNPYFIFDRGGSTKMSMCCRLVHTMTEKDLALANTPEKMRFCALQNVSINLPRLSFNASSFDSVREGLKRNIELAVLAHKQKKNFIGKLLEQKKSSLALLKMDLDGTPYVDVNKASYLIGQVGLNELVQGLIGEQLHESEKALKLGLQIIAEMNSIINKYNEKEDIKFVIEQSPAESTAYRFARLDYEQSKEKAGKLIKGDIESGEIYYTNSTQLSVEANISAIERVMKEGKFHPLIPAGSITHIWLGDTRPDPSGLVNFVKKTFKYSTNAEITFSPDFTVCLSCGKLHRGLIAKCTCGSEEVDGITRITGYFTTISGWNKGKRGELKNRKRNTLVLTEKSNKQEEY